MCVGRVILGARRDPRSHFDSVFQLIQDQEVKKTFGGKGFCAIHPTQEGWFEFGT
jgi:hypothetical protein